MIRWRCSGSAAIETRRSGGSPRALITDTRGTQRSAAFARGVFNVLTGNDDDHGRHTAFLLDPQAGWTLAPAYGLVYQPGRGARGMAVLGKERDITRQDFEARAARHDLKPAERETALSRVVAAVQDWPAGAAAHEVPGDWTTEIAETMEQRLGRGFR